MAVKRTGEMQTTAKQVTMDTNVGVSYATSLASLRMIRDVSIMDISEDDFEFIISDGLFLPVDRSRCRRIIEAIIYGALDYVGYPRLAAPAEFVAAAIAYYIHPVNIMTACVIMEGCEFTETVIKGVERPLTARELFSHVLRIKADADNLRDVETNLRFKVQP